MAVPHPSLWGNDPRPAFYVCPRDTFGMLDACLGRTYKKRVINEEGERWDERDKEDTTGIMASVAVTVKSVNNYTAAVVMVFSFVFWILQWHAVSSAPSSLLMFMYYCVLQLVSSPLLPTFWRKRANFAVGPFSPTGRGANLLQCIIHGGRLLAQVFCIFPPHRMMVIECS